MSRMADPTMLFLESVLYGDVNDFTETAVYPVTFMNQVCIGQHEMTETLSYVLT